VLLGLWLLPGISLATVIVIACIVVPIDFAAAPSTMRDGQIPGRVSDLLNAEAGYGDGIISPIFVFALAVADIHVQALSLGVNANGFIAAFLCGIGYHYLLTAATQR
jgi:NhaP-type Na+/H+ or K+/H+ antiporter